MDSGGDRHADWGVVGQDWAVDFLRRSLRHGRSRHAYLFSGSASLGKMTLARAFAMALNCQARQPAQRPCQRCRHCTSIASGKDPDLILAQSTDDGAPTKIDAIREVSRLLALKPYTARYRVAIFDDFDRVAPLAQDALLKTLEEPAPEAVLIVLADAAERVLPTIRSRAQHVPLRPSPSAQIAAELRARGCPDEQAQLIARLSGGRMGWALSALSDESALAFRAEMVALLGTILANRRLQRLHAADELSKRVGRDKAMLHRILEMWLSYWRDVMLQGCGRPVALCNSDREAEIRALSARIDAAAAHAAISATQQTMRALATNANVRLLLDALFLEYPTLTPR